MGFAPMYQPYEGCVVLLQRNLRQKDTSDDTFRMKAPPPAKERKE